jgi:hypothetical protein
MAKRYVPPYDPFADVKRAQQLAREGVEAYGEQLQPYLLKDIGSTLGSLNEIGALRSGGTQVALRDLTGEYGNRIGQFARGASLEAIGSGLAASDARLRERALRNEEEAERRRRRGALLSSIGSVLGAGIGFIAAGPAGAATGGVAGSKIGGQGRA